MNGLLVACLCAEWCDTCRAYRRDFDQLRDKFPQHRFIWIDIEDQSDLVADIDVENFPTLLIADRGRPLFAGVMLPYIGHLERMLLSLDSNEKPVAAEFAAYQALAQRLDSSKP